MLDAKASSPENTIEPVKVWVGKCGCYSNIRKPSFKPWFHKPVIWNWDGVSSLAPVSFGFDEWCRKVVVLGFFFTGQIAIPTPFFAHGRDGHCNKCGSNDVDVYLSAVVDWDDEDEAEFKVFLKESAKNFKKNKL